MKIYGDHLLILEVFEVPSQQILTTDSVTLTVDAVVYYRWGEDMCFSLDVVFVLRVFDPLRAAVALMDYNQV